MLPLAARRAPTFGHGVGALPFLIRTGPVCVSEHRPRSGPQSAPRPRCLRAMRLPAHEGQHCDFRSQGINFFSSWPGALKRPKHLKLSTRDDSFRGAAHSAEVLGRFHFTQLATPVQVHLVPSCTQSHFTGPILFNPRIMQRLMTFSMDCAHASPRLLAEAVAVVACPS